MVVRTPEGVYVALTPEDFERHQLNLADIIRYVRLVDAQLDYYRSQP